ncbi:MAG: MFS transporter [Alicyclobacillus sp.]|nr:MFS transporter [Alicyclobacillus sp.]
MQSTRGPTKFFYGWVVLAVSFLGLFASLGIRVSFGAYVTSWQTDFSASRAVVTVISMVSLAVYGLCQPWTGRLNDRYGARWVLTISLLLIGLSLLAAAYATQIWQLVLLYGVVASVGFSGASNVTASAVIARWFVEKRGLAMGIALSGMALGELVVVPAALYLITLYNWRFSMLVLGLMVTLIFVPISYLFIRSKPADMGLLAYGQTGQTAAVTAPATSPRGSLFPVLLRDRVFWALTIPYFICGFTDTGLIATHLIPYAEGKGFAVSLIAATFSIIAVFNIFGTIGTGHLSDRVKRNRLLAGIYAGRGITLLLLLYAHTPLELLVFGVLYGATEMASIAPTSTLCAHCFQRYSTGTTFGYISVSHQIGSAVGAFLPGVFYDAFHSYTLVMLLSVAMLWAGALIVLQVQDTEIKHRPPVAPEVSG